MVRRWTHDVSAAWLEARKSVLTATEIKSLWPEYKKLQKKPLDPGDIPPGFAGVWAEKNSDSELDTSSPSFAAARGHVMEPYAVESWNAQTAAGPSMFHWDDCVIMRNGVGFSPDAMNTPQYKLVPSMMVRPDGMQLMIGGKDEQYSPTEIMEIKSYEPKAHMKALLVKDKMKRDELMQVAVAFYVLPKLQYAYLVFFCPAAPISMDVIMYTREEMQDMIDDVSGIADMYYKVAGTLEDMKAKADWHASFTEQEIWDEFVSEQSADNQFMLK